MRSSDFDEKSAGYLIGKEYVIVLVVVFSALSFALGFFVGKSGRQEPASTLAALPQQEQQPGSAPTPPFQAPAPPQTQAAPAQGTDNAQTVVIEPPRHAAEPDRTPKPALVPVRQVATKKDTARETSQPVYSVQLGAFRSLSEAKSCKAGYENKGVRSFIVTVTGKQNEKVYKVKSGEFTRKSDAEILSVKLKKTEGLNAFVTLRNE